MLKYFKDVAYCVMLAEPDPSVRMDRSLTRSMSLREDLLGESARISSKSGKKTASRRTYSRTDSKNNKLPKFPYSRPEFLHLKTDDEINVTADHQIRPIILPKDGTRLPWKAGYAECINAGKSARNEDQAACYEGFAMGPSSDHNNITHNIPWTYFGIFDGHAGTAVAVAAAAQLHDIIGRRLDEIADMLIALEFGYDNEEEEFELDDDFVDCSSSPMASGSGRRRQSFLKEAVSGEQKDKKDNDCKVEPNINQTEEQINTSNEAHKPTEGTHNSGDTKPKEGGSNEDQEKKSHDAKPNSEARQQQQHQPRPKLEQESNFPSIIDLCRNDVTVDSLIRGTLEAAFCEMDLMIGEDKEKYKMAGGCTAICGLFILGNLYICNAGDSRAIVYKNKQVIPMSFDFTPTTERDRILRLAMQRPELMDGMYTHLDYVKRPTPCDLGKRMLYKDAYMTGWSTKTIKHEDLLYPLVWGKGKRSRVLGTIGVTRGFGDHELKSQQGSVMIKPFLTAEPEVRVLEIERDDTIGVEDVLIMGSDGLWDVTSNEDAGRIVENSFDLFPDNEEFCSKYRYITAAQDLVIHSRGQTNNINNIWRTKDDRLASMDDIAVFVIPLKQYRDEYLEWKKLRSEAALEALSLKKRSPPPPPPPPPTQTTN